MIKFGEWRPDDAPFNNEGLLTATNVLPGDDDYLPIPAAENISSGASSAMDDDAIGAIAVRDIEETGLTYNFVGTKDKLYLLSSASFSDVSKSGGYSGSGDDDNWFFAQVGNDVIATNFQDAIQVYTVGTSSLFANLVATTGTIPKARAIAKIGDFLVIGNLNDATDGFVPQRVQWAGIGTTTSWEVSATTQADFQDLDNNFGWIQSIHGGEFGGVIFQEFGIIRMTYAGSPLVFQFDVVKNANGALSPGGQINLGDAIAYIGQDGFYLFNGQDSINIGTNAINSFFFDDYDPIYVNTISATLYPNLSICAWSYRSTTSPNDVNDKILFYNYARNATKRWSIAEIDNSVIFRSLSEGYTLEQLDDFGDGNQTLETLPFSLDSKAYMGNTQLFGLITASKELAGLTGTPLAANIITGESQIFPGSRAQINRVRPFVDYDSGSATVQMRIGTRENLNASVTWTDAITLTTSGYATARSTGRYHRLRLTTSGTFRAIQGADISAVEMEGNR